MIYRWSKTTPIKRSESTSYSTPLLKLPNQLVVTTCTSTWSDPARSGGRREGRILSGRDPQRQSRRCRHTLHFWIKWTYSARSCHQDSPTVWYLNIPCSGVVKLSVYITTTNHNYQLLRKLFLLYSGSWKRWDETDGQESALAPQRLESEIRPVARCPCQTICTLASNNYQHLWKTMNAP